MSRRTLLASIAFLAFLLTVVGSCVAPAGRADTVVEAIVTCPSGRSCVQTTVPFDAATIITSSSPNVPGDGAELRLVATASNRVHPLVRLDTSALQTIVGARTVLSARLDFFVPETPGYTPPDCAFDLHRVTQPWTQAGATWNCANDAVPGDGSFDCTTAETWAPGSSMPPWGDPTARFSQLCRDWLAAFPALVSFDVTRDIESFLASPSLNRGWVLTRRGTGDMDVRFTTAKLLLQLAEPTSITAPALDRTVATTLGDATAFLYTGASPVQTGVAPGTIDPTRAAVLRGLVRDEVGAPLAGVAVDALGHPEFGATTTRADGTFAMAVNGGGSLVARFASPGRVRVQRRVETPWNDYVWVHDVTMRPCGSAHTVTLPTTGGGAVVQGDVVGTGTERRRTTVYIPAGVRVAARFRNAGGGLDRTLPGSVQLRATELTVEPNGVASMPGLLPANSGYTFATELDAADPSLENAVRLDFVDAADEATPRAVVAYVEDFLRFGVRVRVPAGFYDREQGQWVGSDQQNGHVIRVLDFAGGRANSRSNVPDYMIRGGMRYTILSDLRGSPRLVISGDGTSGGGSIVQYLEYDEFGRVVEDTYRGFQPFGFAGGLYDPDTGLVRFGARDYDPHAGRWTAPDPIGFAGGDANLYAYVGNDPVNYIDPDGRVAHAVVAFVGWAAVDVALQLALNGGRWECVDALQAIAAGALGVVLGGSGSAGARSVRSGLRALATETEGSLTVGGGRYRAVIEAALERCPTGNCSMLSGEVVDILGAAGTRARSRQVFPVSGSMNGNLQPWVPRSLPWDGHVVVETAEGHIIDPLLRREWASLDDFARGTFVDVTQVWYQVPIPW